MESRLESLFQDLTNKAVEINLEIERLVVERLISDGYIKNKSEYIDFMKSRCEILAKDEYHCLKIDGEYYCEFNYAKLDISDRLSVTVIFACMILLPAWILLLILCSILFCRYDPRYERN